MTEKKVEVPQRDLDAVEQARLDLYALLGELGLLSDLSTLIRFQNITERMWKVGNTNYPEIHDLKD